jgi:hypothetical protein
VIGRIEKIYEKCRGVPLPVKKVFNDYWDETQEIAKQV